MAGSENKSGGRFENIDPTPIIVVTAALLGLTIALIDGSSRINSNPQSFGADLTPGISSAASTPSYEAAPDQTSNNQILLQCPTGTVGSAIIYSGGSAWTAAEQSVGNRQIIEPGYLYQIHKQGGSYLGVIDTDNWNIYSIDPKYEIVRHTNPGDFACAVPK